ncbi:hypothetical protein GCM10009799_16540 [Nocardiopsis rhodophaea]|uniref:DUF3558 domain-containing protein n=1 Tax=Nocardiopsis rhodophaea TaxID=280238 RepID=A0ABN2SRN2_9ACTN
MSDNGPYPQPPQFPQDGEGGSGGQPPYGGAYGQPGPEHGGPHPGQQYPSGPHQAPYGGQNTGGQPGYGYGGPQHGGPQFQQPPEQPMYAGPQGPQPPYGGPGMPGGPGGYPPPPPPKRSSAGMWIVIGGGAVILLLVIAVVIVILKPSDSSPSAAPQPDGQARSDDQPKEEADDEPEPKAKGEPPYKLPEDACQTYTEDKLSEYAISDSSKNLSDNRSACRWRVEGEGDSWGTFSLEYRTPFAGSDSVEGAKDDFASAVKYATDESNDYMEREVHEEEDVKLGEEAKLIFSTEKITRSNYSVATLLVREGNITTEVKLSMSPGLNADESVPAPLEFSDVEDMMLDLGKASLTPIGS